MLSLSPPARTIAPVKGHDRAWSPARVARLGFLVGLGWSAPDVGRDPLVGASSQAVRAQARRLGLGFRDAAGFRLPHAILGRLAEAADRRGLERGALIHRLLMNAGSDDDLIDNILDDRS